MIERQKQDAAREIPIYPDRVNRPHPELVKTSIPDVHGSVPDIDPELNTDFEDNSPFQEAVISEMYQRPDQIIFPRTPRIGRSD